jgi:hypothetical protein
MTGPDGQGRSDREILIEVNFRLRELVNNVAIQNGRIERLEKWRVEKAISAARAAGVQQGQEKTLIMIGSGLTAVAGIIGAVLWKLVNG